MNKNEASLYLGVSVRTLDTYTSQGRIKPTFISSHKSRPVADFTEEDLSKLKEELGANKTSNQPVSAIEVSATEFQHPPTSESSLVRLGSPLISPMNVAETSNNYFINQELLGQVIRLAMKEQSQTLQDIAIKPLLTFAEAAQLTGISEKLLREAARVGELKALKIGRAQRIRQADLNSWIDRQFDSSD